MRKILPHIMVGLTLCDGAYAATKCVYLDQTMNCYNDPTPTGPEFSATCTGDGVSTRIEGMGICSMDPGAHGDTTSTLTISSDASKNIYCWCKLISPGVGNNWVRPANNSSTTDPCSSTCANSCLKMLNYYDRDAVGKLLTDLH